MKQLLTVGSLFALLLASSLPAQAQTQQPAPTQTPAVPQEQFRPEELKQFANAVKQVQVIQQDSLKQMTQVVQRQGLTEQRFVQIYQAQQNPSTRSAAKITPAEQQNFEKANVRFKAIQQEAESKMEQAVKNTGLGVQRFNQIFAAVRQNPALKQQVQQMIRS